MKQVNNSPGGNVVHILLWFLLEQQQVAPAAGAQDPKKLIGQPTVSDCGRHKFCVLIFVVSFSFPSDPPFF